MALNGGRGRDGTVCPPGDLGGHLETSLVVVSRGKVLLASSGWRLVRLLYIYKARDKPSMTKNDLTPNVNRAKTEKSWPRGMESAGTPSGKASRGT